MPFACQVLSKRYHNAMTMLRLMLQRCEDKLPTRHAPLHNMNVFLLPATTSARATLFDATSHPRPRTSHELLTPCSSPLQRQHSLDCLPACLICPLYLLVPTKHPSPTNLSTAIGLQYSTRGTPLGTSRPLLTDLLERWSLSAPVCGGSPACCYAHRRRHAATSGLGP